MATISKEILEIFSNIISAVESGGQIYGNGRWNAYIPANTNTSNETSCTIGCFQNYAGNAKKLLLRIRESYPTVFSKFDTAEISKDLDTANWNTYSSSPSSAKAKSIQAIIGSSEGIKVQKEMFGEEIQTYANDIESKYEVVQIDALLHCVNIKHLGGAKAVERILGKTARPVTLDAVKNALLTDTVKNQVGAEPYKSRQACIYKWLKEKVTPLLEGASTLTEGNNINMNAQQKAFHDTYKILLGRNVYSQNYREYVFKTYGGKYYSDCSSSICAVMNKIGILMSNLNTAGMYYSALWKKVNISIVNGHITDVSKLRVGDALMFVGSDPSRPLQIGHVEAVYEINGTTENKITICGHGSGNPSLKNLKDYLSSRYTQLASNGKRKQLVCVLRAIPDTVSSPARDWLQKGDTGSAVKTLQSKLMEIGFSCGDAGADGEFGDGTEKAVITLQQKYGLAADGQAGVKTQLKIGELLALKNATLSLTAKTEWIKQLQKAIGANVDGVAGVETLSKCPTLQTGSNGTVTKLIQTYLGDFCKIGVTGGYDGEFGVGSHAAVMEFQKQMKLNIDGVVGEDTWKKMLEI